jgi:excinuclease UvrABC ATPase subunit
MLKNLEFLVLSLAFAACTNVNTENKVNSSENDTSSIVIKNSAETVETDTTNAIFTGDLNGDSEIDKIELVEKKCGEDDENADFEDAFCRTVVIYLVKNGKFEQFASNSEIVECSQCGGAGVGDPFRDIVIKNGYFTIEQLFGACTKTYIYTTFKYDKASNDFFLHKVGNESYDCHPNKNNEIVTTTTEKSKKDFGKITFSEYSGGAEFIE